MAFRLSIEVAGEKQLDRVLSRIPKQIKDGRSAFRKIINRVMIPSTKAQFQTQGRHGGSPWPDYTTAEHKSGYVAMKRSVTGASPILMRWTPGHERLYPSLTKRVHPSGIRKAQKDGLQFGTTLPYALKHQRGIGLGWKGKYSTVRRRLIELNEADKREAVRILQAHYFKTEAN